MAEEEREVVKGFLSNVPPDVQAVRAKFKRHWQDVIESQWKVLEGNAADMYETLSVARTALKDLANPDASPALILSALLDEQIECLDRIDARLKEIG